MYSELASKFDEQKMKWARQSVAGYHKKLQKIGISETKTLLDLGGGLGYYSKAFEELNFKVTLVEQDPVSANFARSVLSLNNILEQSIDSFFQTNNDQYDIVFLRHVIEHATQPDKLISQISNCLKPNGILIIETDNNAGIEIFFNLGTAKYYKDLYQKSYSNSSLLSLIKNRPLAVDPPRHLYGFRESNLSLLLRNNSLSPVVSICYSLGDPIYWPNLPNPTLKLLLDNLLNYKFKLFVIEIINLILYPIRLFLQKIGLASGICLYAQKQDITKKK